jgi:hypothetical protein
MDPDDSARNSFDGVRPERAAVDLHSMIQCDRADVFAQQVGGDFEVFEFSQADDDVTGADESFIVDEPLKDHALDRAAHFPAFRARARWRTVMP